MSLQLKRVLKNKREGQSLFQMLAEQSIAIVDANRETLFGNIGLPASEYPILYQGEPAGWVLGGRDAALIAAVLTQLLHSESEITQMADEVLELYRELNLLYQLSERLGVSLDPDELMQITLEEASRLIKATSAAVILKDETENAFISALFGEELQSGQSYLSGEGIIGRILSSGKGAIFNELGEADPLNSRFSALIAAPLTTKQQVIGWVVLVHRDTIMYTAGDLKLLSALASQAAPAIENALLHEKTLREAKQREAQLQRRIDELRIELDEARQEQKVSEIVETEYFRHLQGQSEKLRRIIDGDEA